MAITKIKNMSSITHVENALEYAMENKKDTSNDNITHNTLVSFLNTSSNTANKICEEWEKVRKGFDKDNGRIAYQIIQNFGDGIDPTLANEIGMKFASELLGNRQAVVATHTNTQYIHNHIIFNSPDIETGEKYNNCNKTYYGQIRKISDRLCSEYGLKVLEDTRNGKLIFYRDDKGNKKYFEPTKRKSELEHYDSRYAQAKVWSEDAHKRKTRASQIISDMELLIPLSSDFENFIYRMKSLGYGIKAKTSKGEWREHITYFEPNKPEKSKGIRDTSKELKGYSRIEIETRIRQLREKEKLNETISYSKNDLSDEKESFVFENYKNPSEVKADKRKDGTARQKIDKLIAEDICNLNKVINAEYYSAFKRKDVRIFSDVPPEQRKAIERVNNEIHALNTIERYKLNTFKSLHDRMTDILSKRNEAASELDAVRQKLYVVNRYISIINSAKKYKENIDLQMNMYGKAYSEIEDNTEIDAYNTLLAELKNANLDTEEKQQKFISDTSLYNREYRELVSQLQNISSALAEVDKVHSTLKKYYIDVFSDDIQRYEQDRKADETKGKRSRTHRNEHER